LTAETGDIAALRAERDALAAQVQGLEQALVQAQERFDVFASTLPGISWETWGRPYEDTWNYVSPSIEAITGHPAELWQNRPGFCIEVMHPEDRERVRRETAESYARGDLRGVQEYRLHTRTGALLHLHVRYTIVRDERGEAIAWQAFSLDVTAQREAEAARDRMQDELIRGQAELLSELSTPLMPISDEIVAMPLIGRIDGPRAARVIEVLLQGVAKTRARFAILDITGVREVDVEVGRALLRTAQATRLLGVETIITGVRPEVAQAFVGLDERLDHVATLATLQTGVAYAMRRGQLKAGGQAR
jgi:rsbT co-antagonist protein RsbR